MSDGMISWTRRNLLRMAGVSTTGTVVFSQASAAKEDNPDVSVQFNDQESDGKTIVIDSLFTEVEAEIIIFHSKGDRKRYKVLTVEEGTEFTERTIELDEPIPETQLISISIQPPEGGYSYGGSRATVAVGDSLEDIGPTVERIEADPDAGFHSPYFLFMPEPSDTVEESVNDSQLRPLIVKTYVWGDFDERVDGARERAKSGVIAAEMNCPMLVAPLPFDVSARFGLREGIAFNDSRRERVDLQLLAMIEDTKSRLKDEAYTVAEQIHFSGGSSAGVFIDTFAALHPEYVEVFSSGANGATFLPIGDLTDDIPTHGETDRTSVPWPFGTADFEARAGKEFNRDAWMDINQYRWIGAEDQDTENSGTYVHKAWKEDNDLSRLVRDIFGKFQVDHRFETSRAIYNHLGVPAKFVVFEGAGHVPESRHHNMIQEYHHRQIAEHYELVHLVPQNISDEIQVGDTVTVSVLAKNPTVVRATTSVSLAVNGTEADATEITVGPNNAKTVELEATLEEADEYTLSINEGQFESLLTVVKSDSQSVLDGGDSTADAETDQEKPTSEATPGFGISQTIAALGGIGYLIKQRLSETE